MEKVDCDLEQAAGALWMRFNARQSYPGFRYDVHHDFLAQRRLHRTDIKYLQKPLYGSVPRNATGYLESASNLFRARPNPKT